MIVDLKKREGKNPLHPVTSTIHNPQSSIVHPWHKKAGQVSLSGF
jgi:hypothetical protein